MPILRISGAALWRVALCAALACAAAGCADRPAAFEYRSTPVEGWEPGDTLKFRVDTVRTAGTYRLVLGVRTSASTPYPFRSLWLVVRQHWHNPERVTRDTVECRLTDGNGEITGTGVSVYQYTQELQRMQLAAGSSADISIIHIMRREILPGVADVGIRLSRE